MHSRLRFSFCPPVNARCPHPLPTPQEELAAATVSDGVPSVLFLYTDEFRRLISSPLLFFSFSRSFWDLEINYFLVV